MIRANRSVDGTDHQRIEENLSAYLDGELSPQERDVVEHHLATCQECQWNVETLRQVVQWTSELPVLAVPRVYTIHAPIQPERAPRRRSLFLPALQGATALVALLLFFAVAGDFLLGSMRQASAPQTMVVMETVAVEAEVTMAPAEAPASEVMATQVVQAIVEVTKEVEVEEARKELAQPPPPSAPEATSVPAPAMAAEAVVTATPEEGVTEAPGVGGALEAGAAATAQPQLEAPRAAAPPTAEAMADMTLAATVPTPTVLVTPAWPATTALAAPTVVAKAEQPAAPVPAEGESPTARTAHEPGPNWWQVAVYALGGLFVLLLIATVVATIQSRGTR